MGGDAVHVGGSGGRVDRFGRTIRVWTSDDPIMSVKGRFSVEHGREDLAGPEVHPGFRR